MFSAQLISSLLRAAQPNPSSQSLTFIVGQVLRGEVAQILPDQSAVIKFGSMNVHAKIETALELGQKSWFQVQSQNHPITLKMLPASKDFSSNEGKQDIPSLLSFFGMKKGAVQEQILQFFIQQKLPMEKKMMQQLPALVQELGGRTEDNLRAIQMAIHKNVPVTKETIQSIRTFLFDAPLHQQMQEVMKLLPEKQAQLIKSLLSEVSEPMPMNGREVLSNFLKTLGVQNEKDLVSSLLKNIIAPPKENLSPSTLGSQTNQTQASQTQTNQTQASQIQASQIQASQTQASQTQASQIQANQNTANLASQTIAANNETQSSANNEKTEIGRGPNPQNQTSEAHRGSLQQQGNSIEIKGNELNQAKSIENVKFQLQQMLTDPLIATEVKEKAQNLIHHITGQQLFLHHDSEQGPFYQLLFQLPFILQQQEKTLYGTIEGRKNNKGEIDRENCRMIFYLQLQSLGETCVDVQIINSYVSITIFNEKQQREWLGEMKEKLSSALDKLNYTLSSLIWKESIPAKASLQRTNHPYYHASKTTGGVDIRL